MIKIVCENFSIIQNFSRRGSSSPPSQSSGTSEKRYTRPKGPSRLSTGKGITTLERVWGPLFDEEGRPTLKRGQFLRGLAVHIVRIACVSPIAGMSWSAEFVECRLRIMSRGTVSSSHRPRWHNTMRMSSCRRKCTCDRVCICLLAESKDLTVDAMM